MSPRVRRVLIQKDKKHNLTCKDWLCDLLEDTDRLFVMASGNESTLLKRSGYTVASAQGPLLDKRISNQCILVGNYDIMKQEMNSSSNLAGDFKKMFITAPGSWCVDYVGHYAYHPLFQIGGAHPPPQLW